MAKTTDIMQNDTLAKRLKVVVCAYACEPDRGSDPGVGWNWVKQIARFHEVWVITRSNNKNTIQKYLEKTSIANVHFCYFDYPYWLRFWKKGERGIHLYYYLWIMGAYFFAKRLHKQIDFDLAHHITFPVDWMPSFICLLPIPFIWGPIGGGVHKFPSKFLREFGMKNIFYEIIRYLYQNWGFYIDPFVRLTRRRAARILVSTKECANSLPKKLSDKVVVVSRIGISDEEKFEKANLRQDGIFRVFSTGRLVPWKGYTLEIRAFSKFIKEFPDSILVIGGKGRDRKRLDALVRKLNVSDNVHLVGQIPSREEVFKQMISSDVVLLPSLRDGPLVTMLEAMYACKPIICVDAGGASDMITEDCGIKVRGTTPKDTVIGLTNALLTLANDSNLREKMGKNARKRVEEYYNWDKKGDLIKSVYDSIVK